MSRLAIDVGGWPTCSGARATLYLDPEADPPRVYSYGDVGGNSWPALAHHGRHRGLGSVPVRVVPDDVADWLRAHEEDLLALVACYEGSTWDGNNHVGSWSDDALDLAERLGLEWTQDLAAGRGLRQYADPGDVLSGDWASVRQCVIDAGSIEAAAGREADAANDAGGVLDPDETEQAIRDHLAGWLAEHADSEDGDRDHETVVGLRALLAPRD